MNKVLVAIILLGAVLVGTGASQQSNQAAGTGLGHSEILQRNNLANPHPFQNYVAPVSGTMGFLFSPAGLEMIRRSNHPNLRGFLEQAGIDLGPVPVRTAAPGRLRQTGHTQAPSARPCSFKSGTNFNLEPEAGMPEIGIPVPQNEESVDFVPAGGIGGADLVVGGANDYRGMFDGIATAFGTAVPNSFGWGFSGTGYYVNRGGGCGADFEGGLPNIFDPVLGQDLYGLGDPVIAIDAGRGNVFAVDLRLDRAVTAVGLFRTTVDRLKSETTCPSGTHLTDKDGADTTAQRCWPVALLVGAADPTSPHGTLVDKPHIRVDERASGPGAGDVYISWTHFGIGGRFSFIMLAACKGTVTTAADCSKPIQVSGFDPNAQFSHISVLPNGAVTVTYAQFNVFFDPNQIPFLFETVDIKHVNCLPQGAPARPVCRARKLVTTETQPLLSHLANGTFRVATYPTHDLRVDAKGRVEEVLAWARCKQDPFLPIGSGLFAEMERCADSDVVFTTSLLSQNGVPKGWSEIRPVNANTGDQVQPWVTVNRQTGDALIAYYSSENDVFHHRLQLMMSALPAGTEDIADPAVVLSTPDEPDADPVLGAFFIGDYLGIVSRGGRTYTHSTVHKFGRYGDGKTLGQDNVLTGFSAVK